MTININDLALNNTSLDEKRYENIIINHAAYKSPHGVKPLRIIFD